MDIGTGKMLDGGIQSIKKDSLWKIDGVNVYCYDIAYPNADFTVVDFSKIAKERISYILEHGKTPFVVGGTGFYLDVLFGKAAVSSVPPDWGFRLDATTRSCEELYNNLVNANPQLATKVDKYNKVRVIRALEISGAKDTQKNRICDFAPVEVRPIYLGLTATRGYLYERADMFVDALLQKGILDEIQHLVSLGYGGCRPLSGLIYDQFVKLYFGEITQKEALEKAKFETHAYIRRQLTWFNRNSEIVWFDAREKNLCDNVQISIKSYLNEH
jgi:tRNA dimethylallyltransferase